MTFLPSQELMITIQMKAIIRNIILQSIVIWFYFQWRSRAVCL